MSENYVVSRDLKEAEAMAQALVPYVHRDTLYGSVGAGGIFSGGNMPSLTIGALLMRIRRLNILDLDDNQKARLAQIKTRNQEVHNEWRVHYDAKMVREAHSRLDAMSTFFDECRSDPRLCARVYRPELLRRTIAQEIWLVLHEKDDELKRKLAGVDSQLQRFLRPAEFQWDSILEPAYPKDTFWWLYQHPPVT